MSSTQRKEFDIIGLVDVVFLMIIFGLIIAVISLGGGIGTGGAGIIEKKMQIKVFRPDPLVHQSALSITLAGKNGDTISLPPDQELLGMSNRRLLNSDASIPVEKRLK